MLLPRLELRRMLALSGIHAKPFRTAFSRVNCRGSPSTRRHHVRDRSGHRRRAETRSTGRPATISSAGSSGRARARSRPPGWSRRAGRHQLDVGGPAPEEREPAVPGIHIHAADAVGDPARRAPQRGDLPERALCLAGPGGREVHDRAGVRRPAGKLVIHGIAGEGERRTAGNQLHEDLAVALTPAVNATERPSGENAGASSRPAKIGQAGDAWGEAAAAPQTTSCTELEDDERSERRAAQPKEPAIERRARGRWRRWRHGRRRAVAGDLVEFEPGVGDVGEAAVAVRSRQRRRRRRIAVWRFRRQKAPLRLFVRTSASVSATSLAVEHAAARSASRTARTRTPRCRCACRRRAPSPAPGSCRRRCPGSRPSGSSRES